MTNPTDLVQEMVERLRELQGSGEYPPLTRKVEAGQGLAGGGDLRDDILLELAPDVQEALASLGEVDLGELVVQGDLDAALRGYARSEDLSPLVFYRDFTVMDAPLSRVEAPPVRSDEECEITRITVVVGSPGTQSVVVTVAGHTVTVAPGVESSSASVLIARSAGQSIPVAVAATDASEIVVSLRIEEEATS